MSKKIDNLLINNLFFLNIFLYSFRYVGGFLVG